LSIYYLKAAKYRHPHLTAHALVVYKSENTTLNGRVYDVCINDLEARERAMDKHKWLFFVLDDMETYAQKNGLPQLSEELFKIKLIAKKEVGHRLDKVADA
jgi:hypothetical protein